MRLARIIMVGLDNSYIFSRWLFIDNDTWHKSPIIQQFTPIKKKKSRGLSIYKIFEKHQKSPNKVIKKGFWKLVCQTQEEAASTLQSSSLPAFLSSSSLAPSKLYVV